MSSDDVAFMQDMKQGEQHVAPGTVVFSQGDKPDHLYTVLEGKGLRHKTLPDGRRQVVNFVMPGDFIGLQAGVMGEMRHAVEATTAMTLCIFNRSDLWKVFQNNPSRAYDLTYLAAIEEHLLGDALSRMGQHGARERVAWSLHRLYRRDVAIGAVAGDGSISLPFRQQDLADALGLSLVHTNKTLAQLKAENVARWERRRLFVHQPETLAQIGLVEQLQPETRPLM
ncbi:Crp/Fnr family transcriptional regulator [Pseudaestuariivita atlantica]|nr:Crp/Fnr family transcriptional regulator [Pseudaestuariivita atlantica]